MRPLKPVTNKKVAADQRLATQPLDQRADAIYEHRVLVARIINVDAEPVRLAHFL
jgi:hypothetical protein